MNEDKQNDKEEKKSECVLWGDWFIESIMTEKTNKRNTHTHTHTHTQTNKQTNKESESFYTSYLIYVLTHGNDEKLI